MPPPDGGDRNGGDPRASRRRGSSFSALARGNGRGSGSARWIGQGPRAVPGVRGTRSTRCGELRSTAEPSDGDRWVPGGPGSGGGGRFGPEIGPAGVVRDSFIHIHMYMWTLASGVGTGPTEETRGQVPARAEVPEGGDPCGRAGLSGTADGRTLEGRGAQRFAAALDWRSALVAAPLPGVDGIGWGTEGRHRPRGWAGVGPAGGIPAARRGTTAPGTTGRDGAAARTLP